MCAADHCFTLELRNRVRAKDMTLTQAGYSLRAGMIASLASFELVVMRAEHRTIFSGVSGAKRVFGVGHEASPAADDSYAE